MIIFYASTAVFYASCWHAEQPTCLILISGCQTDVRPFLRQLFMMCNGY